MSLADRLYEWLSQDPNPQCDRILGDALRHAEPRWRERIIRTLLERDREDSWLELIGHFELLPDGLKNTIDPELNPIRGGVLKALQSPLPEERLNALRIIQRRPTLVWSDAVPELTIDASPLVRETVAAILRKMVDRILRQREHAILSDEWNGEITETPRSVVLALRKAITQFDTHRNPDLVETALWLARDLGDEVCDQCASDYSSLGKIIRLRLSDWDHPRLAYFLVTALKHDALRPYAVKLLRHWSGVDRISALLLQSDLLDDDSIRLQIGRLSNPDWCADLARDIRKLPRALRVVAPRWIGVSGITDEDKTTILERWLHSGDEELHSTTVSTLTQLRGEEERNLLEQVAYSASPMAPFANNRLQVTAPAPAHRDPHSNPRHETSSKTSSPADSAKDRAREDEFIMTWLACRRAVTRSRDKLTQALRQQAHSHRHWLSRYMKSPDPRDRALALHIVNTDELTLLFRGEIEHMRDDPVDGIRRVATDMIASIGGVRVGADASFDPGTDLNQAARKAYESARRSLRRTVEFLATGVSADDDEELIEEARELLHAVYPDEIITDNVESGTQS